MRTNYRFKKHLTEPDQSSSIDNHQPIMTNPINVKDIRFQDRLAINHEPTQKIPQNYLLLNDRKLRLNKPKKIHLQRLELPNRFPMLSQLQMASFEEEVQYKNERNKKNVTLLNAIIQILKPTDSHPESSQKNTFKSIEKTYQIDLDRKSKNYQDKMLQQFSEITSQNSTKNYRGPKILDSEITRMSNQNVMRRKIASEEKSRHKYNGEDRREYNRKENGFAFEGVEILTFSNKFPGLKKREERESKEDILEGIEIKPWKKG